MVTVWLASSFCYYLISYQLKYIQGDIYLNGIVSGLSEVMAYIYGGYLMSKLGLKATFILCFLMAFIGMLCLIGF
jgi:hypothetical protein